MRIVTIIALTFVKLAVAMAILALGWMVFSVKTTGDWPFAHDVAPVIDRLLTALPLERPWWGVLILALGFASLLAALPKKVAAPSREPKPVAFFDAEPDFGIATPHVGDYEMATLEKDGGEQFSYPAARPELERVNTSAPWDFPGVADTKAPAHHAEPIILPERPTPTEHQATHRLASDYALEASGAAVDAHTALAQENPATSHEEALATARGHHTQAAALYREGLTVGEHTIALAPEEAQYIEDLAITRTRLATLKAQTNA